MPKLRLAVVVLAVAGCAAGHATVQPLPPPRMMPRFVAPRPPPARARCLLPGWGEHGGIETWGIERKITRDRKRVLVLKDAPNNLAKTPRTLMSVSLTGGPPIALANGVLGFRATPDGRQILLISRVDGFSPLRVVGRNGGPVVTIWPEAFGFFLPPDSQHVVFESRGTGRYAQLRVAPITGGPSRVLAAKIDEPGGMSPDGRYMVYETHWPSVTLTSVPIAGGPAVVLARRAYPEFDFTPDGHYVLFRTHYRRGPGTGTLESVPTAGGRAVVLAKNVLEVRAAADKQHVLFTKHVGSSMVLSAVPVKGGPSVVLAKEPKVYRFVSTPDGRSVVLSGPNGAPDRLFVAVVPLEGGPVRRLDTGPPWLNGFEFAHGGKYLAVDSPAVEPFDIIPLDGRAPRRIDVGTHDAALSPDFTKVAFIVGSDSLHLGTLMVRRADGGKPEALLDHCYGVEWVDANHVLTLRGALESSHDPRPVGLYLVTVPGSLSR